MLICDANFVSRFNARAFSQKGNHEMTDCEGVYCLLRNSRGDFNVFNLIPLSCPAKLFPGECVFPYRDFDMPRGI